MGAVASTAMLRYRFAVRPRWILSHLFVVALVVTMVNLGFWQLRRLHEKQQRNALVSARTSETAAPIDRLLTARTPTDGVGAVEFRRVTGTGRYRPDQQLLVRSRSLDGAPGSWVMVPLVLRDGTAVVVNRGWIANEGRFDAVPPAFEAPAGEIAVTGLVRRTETRGSFGPKDPPTGRLANLARADIARFQHQVPERLLPAWVQLKTERPTAAPSPRPLPVPQLDEGPHFSYAVQWFIFSAVAVGGYPFILRRRARELAAIGGHAEHATLDEPDPHDVAEPGDPRLDPMPGERRAPPT